MKLKGPPKPPLVIFCTFTVAVLFVTVQAIVEPAAVAATSNVKLLPETVAVPPEPMPVHATAVRPNPAAGASLIVVAVPMTLNI